MIIGGLEANKMHLLCYKSKTKLNGPFLLHCVTLCCFYDVNLTISPLDRPITAVFTKWFPMKTSLINILKLFVNNSNNTHYFTNYSTNNRSLSTNDQLNSTITHLINNSINDVLSAAERTGTPVLLSASVSDNSGNSPQVAAPRRPREIDQSRQRIMYLNRKCCVNAFIGSSNTKLMFLISIS